MNLFKFSGNKTFATGTLAALYGAFSEFGADIKIGDQALTDLPQPSMSILLVVVGLGLIFSRLAIKKLEPPLPPKN